MTKTKFSRHIYRTDDGREMIELHSSGGAINLNIALLRGLISYDEVQAIRQAMKEKRDA